HLHATYGRSPSHVSRDLNPYIPSSCVSTRWRSDKLLCWVDCPNGINKLRLCTIGVFGVYKNSSASDLHKCLKLLVILLIQVIPAIIYCHQIHIVLTNYKGTHVIIFHIKRLMIAFLRDDWVWLCSTGAMLETLDYGEPKGE